MSRFNPLLLKMLILAAPILIMLIPLNSVESLIAERSTIRSAAVERVATGSGHRQLLGAALLIVPVTRSWSVDGKRCSQTRSIRVLASEVTITGTVGTERRHVGIYSIPAFSAVLNIDGSFSDPALEDEMAPEPGIDKQPGRPVLFLAVSDPAGIRSLDDIHVDGAAVPMAAATENGLQGISAELPMLGAGHELPKKFSVELTLSGTERLQWLPLAKTTTVHLTSPWRDPGFSGAFAPQGPVVTPHGFSADWRVLQINRDFPQHWADDAVSGQQISGQAFGVDFYQPVDTYQQNYRSIHYAILLIALTFMALFLWERLAGRAIHAMQYAMVGAALSLFYLMLLALSEHLPFSWSYGLSAAAFSSLLGAYFAGILASARSGAFAGTTIGTCYVLLYWLILSEDYALLAGASALVVLLGGIMLTTRRFNWYEIATRTRGL